MIRRASSIERLRQAEAQTSPARTGIRPDFADHDIAEPHQLADA
jgi:hypothetical protein